MSQAERDQNYRLGDLQLKIMKVLWRIGQASVAEVHEQLAGDRLAYTTVATMLRKMEDRGLVRHHEEDRRFIYETAVEEEYVTRGMSDDFLERLFGGSLSSAVSHLLETRDVSREELAELERLIKRRSRRR
jgi:BlaI family penicillinase repressor